MDISVHCDVKIFEWLIKYVDYQQNVQDFSQNFNLYRSNFQIIEGDKGINQPLNIKQPIIDIRNCISILISADFLGMKILVGETLQYLTTNISEIVKLPIDMQCIND